MKVPGEFIQNKSNKVFEIKTGDSKIKKTQNHYTADDSGIIKKLNTLEDC